MRKILHPSFWRRGNGEMLGFAVSAPIFLMLIIAVISISRITIASQQLTVATYAVGRAAVVSSNESLASQRALGVLKIIYGDSRCGTSASSEKGSAWYTMTVGDTAIDGNANSQKWKIGNIAKITVYQKVDIILPQVSTVLHRSIAMMIEQQEDH